MLGRMLTVVFLAVAAEIKFCDAERVRDGRDAIEASIPHLGECWHRRLTLQEMDDSCDEGLVCARKGYKDPSGQRRNFGDCPRTHCCSHVPYNLADNAVDEEAVIGQWKAQMQIEEEEEEKEESADKVQTLVQMLQRSKERSGDNDDQDLEFDDVETWDDDKIDEDLKFLMSFFPNGTKYQKDLDRKLIQAWESWKLLTHGFLALNQSEKSWKAFRPALVQFIKHATSVKEFCAHMAKDKMLPDNLKFLAERGGLIANNTIAEATKILEDPDYRDQKIQKMLSLDKDAALEEVREFGLKLAMKPEETLVLDIFSGLSEALNLADDAEDATATDGEKGVPKTWWYRERKPNKAGQKAARAWEATDVYLPSHLHGANKPADFDRKEVHWAHLTGLCADGIFDKSGQICCSKSCRKCESGLRCGTRPGGRDQCCPNRIELLQNKCTTKQDVACVMQASAFKPAKQRKPKDTSSKDRMDDYLQRYSTSAPSKRDQRVHFEVENSRETPTEAVTEDAAEVPTVAAQKQKAESQSHLSTLGICALVFAFVSASIGLVIFSYYLYWLWCRSGAAEDLFTEEPDGYPQAHETTGGQSTAPLS